MLRPLVNWVLPSCRMIRSDMKQALGLITPILNKRRAERVAALKAGKPPTQHNDAIDWMEDIAKGRPYNPAISQLLLSMAAIHTSADMLTQILFDIASQADLIKALRQEIITITRENGWSKISLYKLVLMDSTIKESQRLKPVAISKMPPAPRYFHY
jgi:cytochrome P450